MNYDIFTIGSGSVAGLTADHAIYIGRVQGKGKGLQLIREATKECLDISPDALLLAATEGIAQALELGHIVGIGADGQISAQYDSRTEGLVHAYDEFWMASGGGEAGLQHVPSGGPSTGEADPDHPEQVPLADAAQARL